MKRTRILRVLFSAMLLTLAATAGAEAAEGGSSKVQTGDMGNT